MGDINAMFGGTQTQGATSEDKVVAPQGATTADIDIFSTENIAKAVKEGSSFEDLPDGEYKVKVEKAEIKASKTSGQPMLATTYKVIDGVATNRLIFSNTSFVAKGKLSPRGLGEFVEFIKTTTGASKEQAEAAGIKAIQDFKQSGVATQPLTFAIGKFGTMVIKAYSYNKKDPVTKQETDVVVEGVNKTFKA